MMYTAMWHATRSPKRPHKWPCMSPIHLILFLAAHCVWCLHHQDRIYKIMTQLLLFSCLQENLLCYGPLKQTSVFLKCMDMDCNDPPLKFPRIIEIYYVAHFPTIFCHSQNSVDLSSTSVWYFVMHACMHAGLWFWEVREDELLDASHSLAVHQW